MTSKEYGDILRYRKGKRSNDFEKGKAMNTMIHNYCFNFISQQSALFCKSQQGFIFVRSDKVKKKRDNCVFIDDNP